jgi:hypothetical protein
MSARLVSLAVTYAMGGGSLRRKGVRQRPWLELRRLEPERTYMLHQVRSLQRAGGGPVRTAVDVLPGERFYDVCRARLQHDAFDRAIEILAPNGQARLSAEALQVAGPRGLAGLWLDRGRWDRGVAVLAMASEGDATALQHHLQGLGLSGIARGADPALLRLPRRAMGELVRLMRPHVHRSMAHALREGSLHGSHLMRRR